MPSFEDDVTAAIADADAMVTGRRGPSDTRAPSRAPLSAEEAIVVEP